MDFMRRHFEVEAHLKTNVNRKQDYTDIKQEYGPARDKPIGKNIFQNMNISANLQTISRVWN